MSDEYPERSYSAFWPVVILLAAFAIFFCVQLYLVIENRSRAVHQLEVNEPNVPKAAAFHDRLTALLKDLIATSQKDANAATVVREALQAGILRQRAADSAVSTNSAPANP
jgi:hypothetical protein